MKRHGLGNALTGMPTPPKESLKVCKAASLSSCSTRLQTAQEKQRWHVRRLLWVCSALCCVSPVVYFCLLGIAGN